jgi:ABC-2 type transport system ATP-binding protein
MNTLDGGPGRLSPYSRLEDDSAELLAGQGAGRRRKAAGAGRRAMIEVSGLHKHFGEVRAIDGISFAVAPGEILGFLGHNGAGKTTTVRVLTGRARPTSGSARVAGFDVVEQRSRLKPLINLVFEDQNLYQRLTGRENLHLFAQLYGVSRQRADDLLETVGLSEAAGRKVKTYSSGMKQRLMIARALINKPRVLFLDEPTRGLDPTSAREVRGLVRDLAETGATVFLTTHYMEEADELCDRVAFLSHGRIVALDSPQELKLRFGERSAVVLLKDRSEHTVRLDDAADGSELSTWMAEGQVLSVHSQEGTLEDVFVSLAGRPL